MKSSFFDLHTHTNKSDGTHSPEEQVRMAKQIGLAGIAITDHDTIAGWDEAIRVGDELGIMVIRGVEISTAWEQQDIHVLGYFFHSPTADFRKRLEELRTVRTRRNEQMIKRLQHLGIEITMEEVHARKKDDAGNVGRPHIAEVMMEKGIVSSLTEAFDKYLGRGAKAYVQVERITPHEAVKMIKDAGGIAVLAHPGLYRMDYIIDELVDHGLDGIEVFHADHTKEDEEKYEKIAQKYQLLITGGSDYHGERNGQVFHAPLGSKGVSTTLLAELVERGKRLGQ